jgi:predicted Holliday junction resolvase-like endonuclease
MSRRYHAGDMKRLFASAILSLLVPALAFAQRRASPLDDIRTVPEKTEYRDTSKYADVMAFLEAIDKASDRVHLTTMGTTNEQRAIPLAVIGAPGASPQLVARTGKLRVYIQGNIHGGEVEGKESAQMLLRDLAAGLHDDWLQSMVFLIAPIYNADGNERFALNNRGPQYGPMGGQGQRPNAQGLDLNRDHMKLDSPEARAVAKLMTDYDPHVALDLHTTNGTRHAYHLTYSPPLHPGADQGIVDLLRKQWFPFVTKAVHDKYGWEYSYYGNVGGGRAGGRRGGGPAQAAPGAPAESAPPAAQRRWQTFDHRPRFNNNYIGLRNRFALLSEAYAYLTFQDRILATNRFIEESLTFARTNADRIRRATEAADRARLVGERLPLRAEMQNTGTVEVLMGEVSEEKHPVDGHIMNLRKDVKKLVTMLDYLTFKGLEPERVPSAYFVPASLAQALDRLKGHGLMMTPLKSPTKVAVEEFRIDSSVAAATAFQNHNERTLTGAWIQAERELPAGTLKVELTQPLGRLAFYLIEPRADDGLVDWNLLDEALKDAKVFPIVRTRN